MFIGYNMVSKPSLFETYQMPLWRHPVRLLTISQSPHFFVVICDIFALSCVVLNLVLVMFALLCVGQWDCARVSAMPLVARRGGVR